MKITYLDQEISELHNHIIHWTKIELNQEEHKPDINDKFGLCIDLENGNKYMLNSQGYPIFHWEIDHKTLFLALNQFIEELNKKEIGGQNA